VLYITLTKSIHEGNFIGIPPPMAADAAIIPLTARHSGAYVKTGALTEYKNHRLVFLTDKIPRPLHLRISTPLRFSPCPALLLLNESKCLPYAIPLCLYFGKTRAKLEQFLFFYLKPRP
jgi:hypothetical protein